ncbi:unnamed protein product, partial [marine sediment metagenome]
AEFNECPDCKVDARLMNSIVQEEVAKGNMGKEAVACTDVRVFCNVDPSKPQLAGGRLPGAKVYRDMCTKCGREFTSRIERGYVTLPTTPGMPPVFS